MGSNTRAAVLDSVWPLLGGGALIVLAGAVAGPRALVSLLCVWAAFGGAGALVLGMPRSAAEAVVALVTGSMLASLCVAVLGEAGVVLDPRVWPILGLAVGLVLALWRRRASPSPPGQTIGTDQAARKWRAAVAGTLVFCLCLLALPMLGVGRVIGGAHRYVAFFGADLFKHAANTSSLALGTVPPLDPFQSGEHLGYYWFSYVAPASALALAGATTRCLELLLGQVVLQVGALVVVLAALCRRLGASPGGAAVAIGLGIAAPSFDGLAVWLGGGRFLELAQQRNMESSDLTLLFGANDHFSASTLFRLCMYVPQHQLAVVLILCWALLLDAPERVMSRLARMVLLSAVPSVSILVYPAAAVSVLGLLAAARFTSRSEERSELNRRLLESTVALAAGLLLAEVWGAGGAPFALHRALFDGDRGLAVNPLWWLPQLLTTFGIMLILGLGGSATLLRDARLAPSRRFVPVALLAGGLGVLFGSELLLPRGDFRMNLEIKASFVAGVALVLGAAVACTRFLERPTWGRASIGLALLLPGLPSVIWDEIWHSTLPWDTDARRPAHVAVPIADMAALDWARKNTPGGASFAQAPELPFLRGGVDTWSPVFAGRAVVAGPRATEPDPLAEELERELLRGRSGPDMLRLMRRLNADYLYLSAALDGPGYGRARSVLGPSPVGLSLVYDGPGVALYRRR